MIKKLQKIQSEIKAPKGQTNKFGNYKYRSCEDILEAVKPLLAEQELAILISDEIILVGERYYIKATATLTDGKGEISVTALAREEENKKGMDASQLTGSTSSYARKYALNGLLAIDDTKDSDSTNTHNKTKKKKMIQTDQLNIMTDLLAAIDDKDLENKMLKGYKVKAIEELDFVEASGAVKRLQEIAGDKK